MIKKLLLAAAVPFCAMGCPQTSCVARGTRVWTPDGWREIEALEVGDIVYSVDEENEVLVEGRVTFIKKATRECVSLEAAGIGLRLTSDHPVWCPVQRDYKPAGDWALGDRNELAFWREGSLERREVDAVSTYAGMHDVFDITVDTPHHNFLAEGFLVHNKSPVLPRCTFEGEQLEEWDACTCANGATGRIFCEANDGAGMCIDCVDAGTIDMATSEDMTPAADMSSGDMSSTGDMSMAADMPADVGASSDVGADQGMAGDAGADAAD